MHSTRTATLLLALWLTTLANLSFAAPFALPLSNAPRFAPDKVLVKFQPGTASSEIAAAHSQAGGRLLKTIDAIGVQVVGVPAGTVPDKVALYRRNPNVAYVEPDYYRLMVVPKEEPGPTPAGGSDYFTEQWYLNNTGQQHTKVVYDIFGTPSLETTQGTSGADINGPEAWDIAKGLAASNGADNSAPKIAVLDSGVDCGTVELQSKCIEQMNFVGLNPGFFGLDPCSDTNPACDNFGHGTFVASEAAAATDNGEGIAGVGWNTRVGAYKVCYMELVTDGINVFQVGLCPLSASAEAITVAATDQHDAQGQLVRSQYHIITMSYGSDLIEEDGTLLPSSPPNTECDAVLYAWNRGTLLVAGAGNNGDTSRFYPAACTDAPATGDGQSTVMAVAASDHNDNRASFSTYSLDGDDWVSLSAPGESILGVLPDAQCSLAAGTDTCVNWWDGTSMATPLVAGAASLVWSQLYQNGVDGLPAPASCTVDGIPCNRVVRNRLETSADKVGASGADMTQWTRHGRLNVAAALSSQPAISHLLSVGTAGDGSGAVASGAGGIDCGSDCTESYPELTSVSLTASADVDSSFVGWSGDCSGTADTVSVTMDSDKNCVATFDQNPAADSPPTAAFTFSCSALQCDFDGNSSSDDDAVVSFEWNFGDGTPTATGARVSYTFGTAGSYPVTLTVTDSSNQSDDVATTIQIKSKGKTKGGSGNDSDGDGNSCPRGKAAQGKC
ncbi:S8 family serine peptidase [Microbulbifer marinus]|uniref:PKD domain-containing protein n=1 Tax=Microbulbifer marinus TaxID=658218 RepID=A0A1H3WE27_9GAMM|nr:S8 family serine peptidase [Microbulbifer marinus]SDZ85220.1 PKD domain-containing protein [Microbulbifer marinus]